MPPLRPMLGRELNAAVAAGYLGRLFPSRVAESPDEALERLTAWNGARPHKDGSNVEGIQAIRDAIHAADPSPEVASAFVITAPHTHWDPGRPILIGRLGANYCGRARRPEDTEVLTPVSFVFDEMGLAAYEWAEAPAAPEAEALERVYRVAEQVNADLCGRGFPLGLALNCRFKPLFSPHTVETVEFQDEDDVAVILPRDLHDGDHDTSGIIQVGWHARSDRAYGLDADGVALLRDLRAWLDGAVSS